MCPCRSGSRHVAELGLAGGPESEAHWAPEGQGPGKAAGWVERDPPGPPSAQRAQCTRSLGVRVGGPHGRAGSSGGAPTGGPGVYRAGDRQALEKPGLGDSGRPPTPALTPRTVAPPAGRSLGSRPGLGNHRDEPSGPSIRGRGCRRRGRMNIGRGTQRPPSFPLRNRRLSRPPGPA